MITHRPPFLAVKRTAPVSGSMTAPIHSNCLAMLAFVNLKNPLQISSVLG